MQVSEKVFEFAKAQIISFIEDTFDDSYHILADSEYFHQHGGISESGFNFTTPTLYLKSIQEIAIELGVDFDEMLDNFDGCFEARHRLRAILNHTNWVWDSKHELWDMSWYVPFEYPKGVNPNTFRKLSQAS